MSFQVTSRLNVIFPLTSDSTLGQNVMILSYSYFNDLILHEWLDMI